VKELFSLDAFWKGTIMGLGPCIATKVLCGPFMGKTRWVIGWAMVGRAEFAYFIAIMAKSLKMMDDKLFAILIWSLIYATVFAPLIFRMVLKRYMAQQHTSADEKKDRKARMGCNACRLSGSLPDIWDEEVERERRHSKDTLELTIHTKDAEIGRLRGILAAHGISDEVPDITDPNEPDGDSTVEVIGNKTMADDITTL